MAATVQQVPLRENISIIDTWNTEALYPDLASWQTAIREIKESERAPYWPSFTPENYDVSNPQSVKKLLEDMFQINRKLEKIYIYAHLLHDQDLSTPEHIAAFQEASVLYNNFAKETSWIAPALTSLSQEQMESLQSSPDLKEYSFFIQKIFRMAAHTGTENEEKILSSSYTALNAVNRAFSSLSDSEIPFKTVKNSKGEELPLSHGLASLYSQSPDRELRKNSYLNSMSRYADYKDTFSELLYGKISAHVFTARARKFSSCLEASLFQNDIPTSVYYNLIEICQKNVHLIKRYLNLKQKILKIDEMKVYDVYAPLIQTSEDTTISYEEATALIASSLQPLGEEYVETLKKGLTIERWVDKYENKNKRSGAYSSGCYDSLPYILVNFKGSIYDGSVLAHEAGHSMHSYFSRKYQSYQNADYPLFLAEIASTFNEILFTKYLTEHSTDRNQKITFISRQLDTIFATLFRQTMFADFELRIHSLAENNEPLNSASLSKVYGEVLQIYLGEALTLSQESEIEWSRIPHFYYNFYVYQYATGISAALAFAHKVINHEAGAVENYLRFLKSGGSNFPIETLKNCGIDMTQPGVLTDAMRFIESQISLLEELFKS